MLYREAVNREIAGSRCRILARRNKFCAVAPAGVPEQLQSVLGDTYRIERELAPGGMSRLFLATERSLDRQVVVKLLPPEYASEVSAARFQREITLAAHLQHPHILPVLTAGSRDGLLYYIMPYVDGESLRQRLEREGKLQVPVAVRLLREVADALARAHAAGVIHRDIKPENILLQHDHALLADFGIARALHDATGSGGLTGTGMGIGTPGYMAPEQLAGERNVDARADVYALAVVAYEMLAGVAPFTGATPQAVVAAHFTAVPKPLDELRPDVPQIVSDAVSKALDKEPDQRFASAAEFRDALAGADRLARGPRRARPVRDLVVAALTLAVAATAAVVWRGQRPAAVPPMIAVLPFENRGDTADDYFAAGMTDEVRSKLGMLPGVQVIASASSDRYRHTTKSPEQIGRELGARFLLTGRIRWEKQSGTSRVRVQPELVQVADVSHATTRWEQPFDADLSDVFKVQTTIAQDVVSALRVALDSTEQHRLEEPPTQNLAAYDLFLRAESIHGYRERIKLYSQAVALDSNFADAWAGLSEKSTGFYANVDPGADNARIARVAAERAVALAPQHGRSHEALALYYGVVAKDERRALDEAQAGLRVDPSYAYLFYMCGTSEFELGRWDDAVENFRKAARLDPQSGEIAMFYADLLTTLHRFPEAQQEADRAIAVASGSTSPVLFRTMVSLAEGDVLGARAVVAAAKHDVDSTALFVDLARYYDLAWLLDSAEQRYLTHLSPAAFDNERAAWGSALAVLSARRGDRGTARAYADSARIALDLEIRATPDNAALHSARGLMLAYEGRGDSAVREARRALDLEPLADHQRDGAYLQHGLVQVYLALGDTAHALDALEPLLHRPYYLTPAWLRIDPTFASLRGNPRFQRLIAEPLAVTKPTD